MKYEQFISSKVIDIIPSGFECGILSDRLYDYQSDIVKWACRLGKSAIFTMTGTGKTAMQLSFADQVAKHTFGRVLVLAPLAVSEQTVREGSKFGIDVTHIRNSNDAITNGVYITNYERLHNFTDIRWDGIVLDESSILKSFDGKTRNEIIEFSESIPYRLACTATPSPNDYMELGNHSEFLGIMSYNEMLATYFVHDGGETSKWRLKGHAVSKFWSWIASWAIFLNTPSDLMYSDEGFSLPDLTTKEIVVKAKNTNGGLFAMYEKDLNGRRQARRDSIVERCEKAKEIALNIEAPVLLWCNLNSESEMIKSMIDGCVEVKGSDSEHHKTQSLLDFAEGKIKYMVTKPSIAGFGMNWQVCHNTIFVGISDSFEEIFQATKRFHRHGQTKAVTRYIITSEGEACVSDNIKAKESKFNEMMKQMIGYTKEINLANLVKTHRITDTYNATKIITIPEWIKTEEV